MRTPPFRLLRSASLGAAILALAAAAHVAAGGVLPAPLILAAIAALTALGTTAATRFKLSLPAMVGLLGASQFALHQAFDTLSAGLHQSVDMPSLHDHSLSAAAQTAAALKDATAAGLGEPVAAMAVHDGSWAMLAAHAAATLATAIVLARGEDALWALAGWLRPLVRPAVVTAVFPQLPAVPVSGTSAAPRPWRYLRSHSRRGPPDFAPSFA
ncbi:hypothetical protein [Arthrobacter sp. 35W]|uniref:hypothetical protein n=1 Tax=Arthrobacter sp. 35W TaxID=1132441 RepID=UPI00047CC3BD|nr:hypothetical protein [Arthrobacter sp. 35W]